MARMDEIDFRIHGEDLQFVEITLDPGEAAIAEPGGMMYMDPGIGVDTVFGDGSAQQQGFMGALLGAGKRLLTGENLFTTVFHNEAREPQSVAFAAPYPGRIVPLDLGEVGGELICQKDSFLAGAKGVELGIALTRRLGAGLFGGEGFILQRLTGDGLVFIHGGGMIVDRVLKPGETIRVDTGCLVALQPSVQYDIQLVRGVKSALFGGEGLFFATLTGPGRVWLQSLPFSRMADRVLAATRNRQEEGSVLGGVGRILNGG